VACSQDKEAGRAVEKAIRRAHKPINMHYFELYDLRTVFHDVTTKFKKTKCIVMAAQEGTGLLVNNTISLICEAIGIQDLKAKIHGSHNTHNTVAAFWKALKLIETPEEVARKRGKAVVDMASLRAGLGAGHTTLFQKSWKVIVPFQSCESELGFSITPPTTLSTATGPISGPPLIAWGWCGSLRLRRTNRCSPSRRRRACPAKKSIQKQNFFTEWTKLL
jgi:hypothetical protein